ncbi:putative membrane protein [Variovorax sp. PBL-H6]|uniref:DUF1003 domain-containing protein n=1 Tax=Variovorax sp. PBL-H6 TaxID=434009 RepID=UPI0013198BFC|nr:DUF1003 domain-containing protein [Variovorax sp. PBL-H6]VTU39429.1 putative membrane protein [Variovorax sp. PBL-H6]
MATDDAAPAQPPDPEGSGEMAGLIDRNIEALIRRRRQEQRETALQERIADAITSFAGSMKFVYLHLLVYGAWIAANLGWLPPVPRFDPTFVVLAMAASVEAIFISTFVLVSQNRMAAQADQRADLDLQISLLSEHEITRLVTLVGEMARRMGVPEAHDPELEELKRDVAPEQVLDRMQQSERKLDR